MARKEPLTLAALVEKPEREYSRILRAFALIQMSSEKNPVSIKELSEMCSEKGSQFFVRRFKHRLAEMCEDNANINSPVFSVRSNGTIEIHALQLSEYMKYRSLLKA